ncbi:hypothetical protein ACQ86N_08460 [Puia sp. P3]|uniref:hypothetical protein n=1 Tax=Puia sp. P3 TaxID=3423952 RepID=UPI003D67DD5A
MTIADPAKGLITLDREQFLQNWLSTNDNGLMKGTILLLEPTPTFKELDYEGRNDSPNKKIGWEHLFAYVKQHRRYLFQIILGFLIAGVLRVFFLT